MSDIPLERESAPAPEEKPKKKKHPILISIVCLFTIAFIAVLIFFGQDIVDYISGLDYQPTSEMASIFEKLKFTWRGELIARAAHPVFETADSFNHDCPIDSGDTATLGCYMPESNRIYIYDIRSDELNGIKESVLAHEVMHAVFNRLDGFEKKNIESELKAFYESHESEYEKYMGTYPEEQFYTELHSIIGQRVHYKDLSEPLQKHYSKYFLDLDAVVNYYDQYHEIIDDLLEKIEKSGKELETLHAELVAKRDDYNVRLDEYNKDVAYHNEQVELGNYNEERYQSLKKRQAALDAEYVEINQFIDDYNGKVQKYEDLLARQKQLYGEMDSRRDIQKEESL